MIYALILLASLAQAQEVSTGAATSLLDEVRISNLGKDTRDLLSGRYRQTGKPTFANGFCFADGTCQTTADSDTGGLTVPSGSTLTINSGAYCVGTSCRVGYSSGTLNTFSFVLQSTTVYKLEYSVSATSGTTTTNIPFYCQINDDNTATNYANMLTSYSSPYNINNLGADARWGLCADGGVQVSAGEGCSGDMTLKNLFGTSNNLIMSGKNGIQLITPGATNFQAQRYSGLYVGNAPWTLTCTPVAGVGWIHEAILYQVGK